MNELWKDIPGYDGRYKISSFGRVMVCVKWDVNRGYIPCNAIMTPTDNGYGYKIVSLTKGKKKKNHYVHRLVAEAFIDNPYEKQEVNHKDYDKSNNSISNLEFVTRVENVNYSAWKRRGFRKGSKIGKSGEKYIRARKRLNGYHYEVCILGKYRGTYHSIEEAICARDALIAKGGD